MEHADDAKKKKSKKRNSRDKTKGGNLSKEKKRQKEARQHAQSEEGKDFEDQSALSRQMLQDAVLWLIQIPDEIADLDQVANAAWHVDPSLEGPGPIGEVTFGDDHSYTIQVEDDTFINNTIVQTKETGQIPVSKTIALHRLRLPEKESDQDD